jgi:hypothetical protein
MKFKQSVADLGFRRDARVRRDNLVKTKKMTAAVVLASFFGEKRHFTVDNDPLIGVTPSFRSFSQALDEVKNDRIFAGIHFRSACDDDETTGIQVQNYVHRGLGGLGLRPYVTSYSLPLAVWSVFINDRSAGS